MPAYFHIAGGSLWNIFLEVGVPGQKTAGAVFSYNAKFPSKGAEPVCILTSKVLSSFFIFASIIGEEMVCFTNIIGEEMVGEK